MDDLTDSPISRLQTLEEKPPPAVPENARPGSAWLSRRFGVLSWERLALLAILALSAFLDLFRLEELGYNNEYYASAVKSMLANWSNFFYGSFDPAGFITVDKPPLFLWVQTAFAEFFGFSGLVLLLPQAIAGVLSVALLYRLVVRPFGEIAGLLSAFALAATPIFVVTSRHNNPESLLILVLLAQVYTLSRAVESKRVGWLLGLAVLGGVGFNLKMLEAFVTLPAFFLVYFGMGRGRPAKKILYLTLASVIVLAVSLSWALLIDSVPPGQRPFIGGSTDNTVTNLILGYNGLNRVQTGDDGSGVFSTVSAAGPPGLLRLLQNSVAGETNWLVPLVAFGLVALFARFKGESWRNPRNTALLAWTGWLGSFWLVFSFAKGIIHPYYLVMLAPPLAALFGAGLVALWQDYRQNGWKSWLLPVGVLVNTAYEVYILTAYTSWNGWIIGLAGLVGLAGGVALVWGKRQVWQNWQRIGLGLGCGLFVAPIAWCVNQLYVTPLNPTLPSARPGLETEAGYMGNRYLWEGVAQPNWAGLLTTVLPLAALLGLALLALWKFATQRTTASGRRKTLLAGIVLLGVVFGGGFAANLAFSDQAGAVSTASTRPVYRYDPKFVAYLTAYQTGYAYLVAVPTTSEAGPLILETGQAALAYGGFMGIDPAMSPAQAGELVRQHRVRFFLVSTNNWFDNVSEEAGTRAIYRWASQECQPVDPTLWKTPADGLENPWQEQLYDCASIFK